MTLIMSFSASSSRKLSLEFHQKKHPIYVTNERETNDNSVRNLPASRKKN